jgi:hypothetical protein
MYLMCFLTLVILTESVNMQSETTLQNNKDVLENWNGISFAAVKHKLSILVIFSRPSTTFLSLKSKELIQNSAHQDGNKEKVFVELPFVTIISGVSSLWKQKKTLLTPSTVSKQNYLDLKQNIGSLTPVMLDSLNKFRNNIVGKAFSQFFVTSDVIFTALHYNCKNFKEALRLSLENSTSRNTGRRHSSTHGYTVIVIVLLLTTVVVERVVVAVK